MTDFHHLLEQAYRLPDGLGKVELLQEAVRLADQEQHLPSQFLARMMLVSACFASGQGPEMMTALAWCLAQRDARPDVNIDDDLLLWQCKHGISYVAAFPDIPRNRIRQLVDDVIQRYKRHGASLRAVYMLASSNALAMGDLELGGRFRELASRERRDQFAESPAWELYFEFDYLIQLQRKEAAWQLAEPVLEERVSGGIVYAWLTADILEHLVRSGLLESALRYQRKAYRLIGDNPKFCTQALQHALFFAVAGLPEQALHLFNRHFPAVAYSRVPSVKFSGSAVGCALFRVLRRRGEEALHLTMPPELAPCPPASPSESLWSCERLATAMLEDAQRWEARFNERNGNAHFSKILKETLDWEQLIVWGPQ